jgi:hypothetical protein
MEFLILPSKINTNNSNANLCSTQQTKSQYESKFDAFQFQNENIGEFKKWGAKSDKTYSHHYETMYGRLLGPFRDKEINFLEIGLGCGIFLEETVQSLKLWRHFLPKSNISIMFQDDVKCALDLKSKVENVFMGDSSDFVFIKIIGEKYGPFDVVIDDEKRHTRKTQINGLVGLWPHIKSKGVYVIEDLFLSINQEMKKSSLDLIFQILLLFNDINLNYMNLIRDEIPVEKYARDIVKDLMSINCYSRSCVLIKK